LFVHVTVVPTLTGNVEGEKAKFTRVTELLEAGVEGVLVGVVLFPDEHAVSIIITNNTLMISDNCKNLRILLFIFECLLFVLFHLDPG
jgi:hypothetical protein